MHYDQTCCVMHKRSFDDFPWIEWDFVYRAFNDDIMMHKTIGGIIQTEDHKTFTLICTKMHTKEFSNIFRLRNCAGLFNLLL